MKKSIYLFVGFIVLFYGNKLKAQEGESFLFSNKIIELEKKVVEHFSVEYIDFLKEKDPNLLLYLNYFSKYSYSFEDIGAKRNQNKFTDIESVSKKSKSNAGLYISGKPDSFNILAYEINLTDEQQVFVEKNSTTAIIVLPKKVFMEKYNNYKNSLK